MAVRLAIAPRLDKTNTAVASGRAERAPTATHKQALAQNDTIGRTAPFKGVPYIR